MTFIVTPIQDGAMIGFERKGLLGRKFIPYSKWKRELNDDKPAVRFLEHSLNEEKIISEGDQLKATSDFVLGLSASQAQLLNMPNIAGLSVDVSLRGRVDSPDGRVVLVWYDPNARPFYPNITGPFIELFGKWHRLSRTLFDLYSATVRFNATEGSDFESRLPDWLEIQNILKQTTGQDVRADKFVGSLSIYQAGAFTLDIRETPNGPDFVPVLMALAPDALLEYVDDAPDAPETDGEDLEVSATEPVLNPSGNSAYLLPPPIQANFTDSVSNTNGKTQPSYVLGRNTYLLLSPELQTALDVVKRVRATPSAQRKEFLRNPRTLLAGAIGISEAIASKIFVETTQYSDRVEGLGLWEKPVLPWLTKKSTDWLPEKFDVQIGSTKIEVTPTVIERIQEDCAKAEKEKDPEVKIDDQKYPTADVRRMLDDLIGTEGASPDDNSNEQDNPGTDKNVVQIKKNLEELEYASKLSSRKHFVPTSIPTSAINGTIPKAHQQAGFDWLVDAWRNGWPGVLLADDMGLGKTFQALAFLAWHRTNKAACKAQYRPLTGPILIVAPTALLDNWKKEADIHLVPGSLGTLVEAFGSSLKTLKMRNGSKSEPDDALDVTIIRQSDWVLTTYETLAIYHRAFSRIPFSIGIFDEMQKVKSPDSINSHAAKTMNIDFVIGMTGTPIENRLEDLWCIMDRIAPGYLGDLKSFSSKYGAEEAATLIELKSKMDQPQGKAPPIMLRRMKQDVAKDLPDKNIQTYKVPMPDSQANVYNEAIAAARQGMRSKKSMLETLHLLRGISLHPKKKMVFDAYDQTSRKAWIDQSARVQKTFEILTDIEKRGEKALIFLEDLAMQDDLASVLAEHFGWRKKPSIINGTMGGRQRQVIVDAFQVSSPGFDVLILSPKAAGIGLTITAANHVIHLSRWWNPAVEDQCNDRAFRIGQRKNVYIHIPVAVHPIHGNASFDLKLDALLERKRSLSRDMLAPPTSDYDVGSLYDDVVAK